MIYRANNGTIMHKTHFLLFIGPDFRNICRKAMVKTQAED